MSDAPSTYDVKQYIEDRMTELVWQGVPTAQAAGVVMGEIKDGNLLEQFVEQLGPAAVAAFWRQDLSLRRMEQRTLTREEEDGVELALVPAGWEAVPAEVTGPRDAEGGVSLALPAEGALPARLFDEMLFKIAGRWMRLGDVRRDDALWLAAHEERRAERAARRATSWQRVAEEIGDGTVRERYGAAPLELRGLIALKGGE